MEDIDKVIKALEDADVTDGVIKMSNQFKDVLVAMLKKQEEEIENLKQTAQSMMEGIVISTPMFHPCENCQEFNCDFCKFKRTHF